MMKLELVKINRHNRVKILCSHCNAYNHEDETYADLDATFKYVCFKCVVSMMRSGTYELRHFGVEA